MFWLDASSEPGWRNQNGAKKLKAPLEETRGVLLSVNDEEIIVAGTSNKTKTSFNDISVIPRGCVVKVVRSRLGEEIELSDYE